MERFIICIDGPSGAGKGTTAQLLAQQLKCRYVSIGDIYRTIAFFVLKNNLDYQDTGAIKELLSDLKIENSPAGVVANGQLVESDIRNEEIASFVANKLTFVAANKHAIIDYYRGIFADEQRIIFEGREAGSLAFPDAQLKLFVTASPEERARRAIARDRDNGITDTDFDTKLVAIQERDEADIDTKKVGVLKRADDAIQILTDNKTPELVVDEIMSILDKMLDN